MNYRRLTGRLITLLRETRQELDVANQTAREQSDYAYETECRMSRKVSSLKREVEEAERAKEDRDFQDWQKQRYIEDLERARQRNDTYDEERILNKIKRGY